MKEISWINTSKFICMIIIYFYHTEVYCNSYYPVIDILYQPFFVTSFFVINGYLLLCKQLSEPIVSYDRKNFVKKSGTGRKILKNTLFKIIIPSILFAGIFYFPKLLLRGLHFNIYNFLKETLLRGCFWFTSALAVAQVLLCATLMIRITKLSILLSIGIMLASISNILYEIFYMKHT